MKFDEVRRRECDASANGSHSTVGVRTGIWVRMSTGATPECANAQTEHARSVVPAPSAWKCTAATNPVMEIRKTHKTAAARNRPVRVRRLKV